MKPLDFLLAADATSRSIVISDWTAPDNAVVYVNKAFTTLTGYTADEVIGFNCRLLQGPETDRAVVLEISEALKSGVSIRRELLNYRKDGTSFWNDLMIDPVRNHAGNVTGFVAIQHDSTSLHSAIQHRRAAEARFASFLDKFPGYAFQRVVDRTGAVRYPYFSASVFRILGLPPDTDWSDGQFTQHMHVDDRDNVYQELLKSTVNLTPFHAEFRLLSLAGQHYWFRAQSTPRTMEDGSVVWDGLAMDITAEKSTETKLAYLANYDALTGLPNRLLFKTLLVEAIAAAQFSAGQLALFSIDLDDFEATNNAFGPAFGDKCLRRMCLHLSETAELRDATIARLGGDEFIVLLPAVGSGVSLLDLAEVIRTSITCPLVVDGRTTTLEACVGVAALPTTDAGLPTSTEVWAEMMRRAHLALQLAKQNGPGVCRLYSGELDDHVRNHAILRDSLQRAIAEEQFELHYQPLVELRSGRIVGAETLVRWNHPELAFQRPDLFIPLAESTGLIVPLGLWILRSAFKQAQAWRHQGLTLQFIAINLSSVQLQRADFIAAVERALTETGADARNFELELTEGTLIEATPAMQEQLEALRRLGFALTIDDFGTGHSTFKYLREFPFDKVKIDQSFVRHMVVNSNDASIIRAMISLTHNLNLKVVAEGVETVMQRDFLRDEGCDIGQGYLFSPPMKAEDFGWILESGLTLPQTDPSTNRPR